MVRTDSTTDCKLKYFDCLVYLTDIQMCMKSFYLKTTTGEFYWLNHELKDKLRF